MNVRIREVQRRMEKPAFACTSCDRASLARVTGGSCRFVRSLCSWKKKRENGPPGEGGGRAPLDISRIKARNGQIIERISSVLAGAIGLRGVKLIAGESAGLSTVPISERCARRTVYFASTLVVDTCVKYGIQRKRS